MKGTRIDLNGRAGNYRNVAAKVAALFDTNSEMALLSGKANWMNVGMNPAENATVTPLRRPALPPCFELAVKYISQSGFIHKP